MPATSLLPLLLLVAAAAAAPVRYDQRQDGDFNLHAHLENFVVVLIPTAGSSGGGFGLVDLLKKAGAHVRTAEQPIQDHQSPKGTPPVEHNLAAEASEVQVAVVDVQPEGQQQPKEVVQAQAQPQPQQREQQEEDLQPAAAEAVEAVLVAESPALVLAKADDGHQGAKPEDPVAPQAAATQRQSRAMQQGAARCPQGQFRDATGVCHYIGSDQRVGDQFFIGLVPPLEK